MEYFSPTSGNDADFIVETPSPCNKCSPYPLAEFGSVNISGAYFGGQAPGSSPDEYFGGCVGSYYHFDSHMATSQYVPPGVPIADPEAFTDPDGCNFPVDRVNPGYY